MRHFEAEGLIQALPIVWTGRRKAAVHGFMEHRNGFRLRMYMPPMRQAAALSIEQLLQHRRVRSGRGTPTASLEVPAAAGHRHHTFVQGR
eukprot:s454_g4.t1